MTASASSSQEFTSVADPLELKAILWPHVHFYREQKRVIYSVWEEADVTVVPAGNVLGKDYVAAFLALAFFLTRHPCRIVTTSAKDQHLRVLWGEIGQFVQTSAVPLDWKKGGPLIINHQDLRKMTLDPSAPAPDSRRDMDGNRDRRPARVKCPLSYCVGMVASQDSMAALQGHHIADVGDRIPRTLFISDESSSVPDEYWTMARTWFQRALVIGNTWPCDNFFKRAVEGDPRTGDRGGDLPKPARRGGARPRLPGETTHHRKVIRITAEDSPNVRLARAQIRAGGEPTGEVLIPGVKTWDKYASEVETWDDVQKEVSHKAQFWKGRDAYLFPSSWLAAAVDRALEVEEEWRTRRSAGRLGKSQRKARGVGCDPGEGVADTVFTAVDEEGVIEQYSYPTPDTSVIDDDLRDFWERHGCPPERVCLDAGGGGHQIADRLRRRGYPVRAVGFGEKVTAEIHTGMATVEERVDHKEERYAYTNRRAQMYGEAADLLDPALGGRFSIPGRYAELLRQLAPIPKLRDGEGRLKMLPKSKRNPLSNEVTLSEILGCSPDEADSFVLAVHAMLHEDFAPRMGPARPKARPG